MSVTQNYKTFKLSASDDAIRYIVAAVMMQLAVDKDRLKSAKDSALVDWLRREIDKGGEAVAAMNVESTREDKHGALEGEMLLVVLTELKFVLGMLADGKFGEGAYTTMRAERIATALLFLENPK